MKNKPIVLALCTFLSLWMVVTYLYADESIDTLEHASDVSIGKDLKEFFTNINGKLKLNLFDHFHNGEQEETGEQDTDRYRFEFDLNLDITGSIGDSITYSVIPRFRFDNVSWATGVIDEPNETDVDRFMLNVNEAFLTYSTDRFDISFGKMIYEWGTADGYNPTNNINSFDFTDIPTAEKIGLPSVSLNYSHDLFNANLVFAPLFSSSRLPDTDNRWVGDITDALENSSGATVTVIPGSEKSPVNNIDNSQFAIRISTSTLLEGWDFSLSYYDGIQQVGVLRSDLDLSTLLLGLPPRLTLFRDYPHCREYGFDFSTTFNSLEIHGEVAGHMTDGDKMDDDYVEYVAGINYTFYDILFGFLEEAMVVLEYAGEAIFDEKISNNEFSGSGDYFRPFKNSVLANINFKFSENTKFKVSGAINLGDDDSYIRPLFSHKLFENTKCEAGVDIISGHKDTFFGRWRQNDRLFIMFTQYF
ncbi:UDP-N-acetylmuramate-alanine ligase [Candidatus Scalindua japonica]|uniref:UDP-N-acetylmuramate-alanine ligase n=1 Tax=Candidatus Scalindua japonica TaxID=1284222 RepID=A0A286TTD3_9BACT|nr:hypothetical protein [Candidatus Scalindua japonica]GAX59128.1 UDP-N-acetylmuramate-alanine ligase [Candidatus Scalindua japonica]